MRCEVVHAAVLSSFCLQQDHRSPSAADAYRMVRPDTVGLLAMTRQPTDRSADTPLQFRPAPEYTTIEVLFLEACSGVVTYEIDGSSVGERFTRPDGRGRRLSTIESRRCGQGMARGFLKGWIRVVRQWISLIV